MGVADASLLGGQEDMLLACVILQSQVRKQALACRGQMSWTGCNSHSSLLVKHTCCSHSRSHVKPFTMSFVEMYGSSATAGCLLMLVVSTAKSACTL